MNILSDQLCKELNEVVTRVPKEQIDESDVPISIKILRKHLTPDGKENLISNELYDQIAKIEDRLNLNFQARKKFRKLLFPSNKDLNKIYEISDFPIQTKDSNSTKMLINSMMIQTPNVCFADDYITLQSIACTGMIKR